MSRKLPSWAVLDDAPGARPRVLVDAEKMYPAILSELFAFYNGGIAALEAASKLKAGEKNTKPPSSIWWTTDVAKAKAALVGLGPDPKKVTAYWLEVAYQAMKMDLQIAMRTFGFDILVSGGKNVWAQRVHSAGRGEKEHEAAVTHAAGGVTGGQEARGHFQALRGALPA